MHNEKLGRGPKATADMKARIEALKGQGVDLIDTLWERHRAALLGEGYTYDHARPERTEPLRPVGQRRQ